MSDAPLLAAASFQQIDLLRQISERPESSSLSDSALVFQLAGPLDVCALRGALEDLIERHAVLRTTMQTAGSLLSQQVYARPLLPVEVCRSESLSAEQVAAEAHASRLSPEEAASGAPLFGAKIVLCADLAVLILRIHHLITDAWSDALLLRDLSELYRVRVEARSPDLPELRLTYMDFARVQHADWPLLRRKVTQHWAKQLAGYPGYVVWPEPAETPDDPYICERVIRPLRAQTLLAVRLAARAHRVTPFLLLVAATTLAIGKVTGQYDLLIGSNVANREDLEKRDLIGYFTNTRLMRMALSAWMDL